MKIVSLMLQSMFPPLKVQSMNLSACKRVILFNLKDDNTIEFRHYGLSARQRQINRTIKKLVNKNKVPNLSGYNDIADFVLHSRNRARTGGSDYAGYSSESEIDDLPGSKIMLPDDFLDKKKNTNVALRLHELGPRMNLSLVKIEEGLCRGNVVHHEYIKRSPAEIKKQLDSLKNKRELKEKRKKEQEENVKRKAKARGEDVSDDDDDQNPRKSKDNDDNDDIADEGDDKRALGKRLNKDRS